MSQKSKKKAGQAPPPAKETPVASKTKSGGSVSTVALADEVEPQADAAGMPVWLFVLMIVLVYWAMLHLDRYAGGFNEYVFGPYHSYKELADLQPKSGSEMLVAKGKVVYDQLCIACHQASGLGAPGQAPPLVGSEWVLGSTNRLARIPLNGVTGPIQVKGVTWNLTMPPFRGGPLLDDDENAAAVLTFIRSSWGNSASPISAAQIKAVRAETATRTTSWTADELSKIE